MSKELGKNLLKIIGIGIVASPLALIGNMYYSSTMTKKTEYKNNLKECDFDKFYQNIINHYNPIDVPEECLENNTK